MKYKKLKIGLIINPWAGVGGAVALKGSDGEDIRELALGLGAELKSELRVQSFLKMLSDYGLESDISFLTFPLSMGENVLNVFDFDFKVLPAEGVENWNLNEKVNRYESSAQDTREAAKKMAESGIDILIFAGGDGTARDVSMALASSPKQLCLGIPTGVKIQSGVFARSPESAAEIVNAMISQVGIDIAVGEVRDIDEAALRGGNLESRYFSELSIPGLPEMGLSIQGSKQGVAQFSDIERESELLVTEEIAACLLERLQVEQTNHALLLIVGAGKTTQSFKRALCKDEYFQPSLLGVDVFLDQQCLLLDASESAILALLNLNPNYLEHCKIIVSVIGGQGFIFGRGSQPISANVIRKVLDSNGRDSIVVLASKNKILGLKDKSLFVDTGDRAINQRLEGSYRVLVNYEQEMLCRVSS